MQGTTSLALGISKIALGHCLFIIGMAYKKKKGPGTK